MNKSKLQFSPPILKSSYISINEDFIQNNTPESIAEIDMPIIHNVECSEFEEHSAFVKFMVTVGEENEKYPFIARVEMISQFTWDEDFDNKAKICPNLVLNTFVKVVEILNKYGYEL